jgi:hypothetical protein
VVGEVAGTMAQTSALALRLYRNKNVPFNGCPDVLSLGANRGHNDCIASICLDVGNKLG